MAAAGQDPGALPHAARRARRARASPPASSTTRPRSSSARRAPSRRSRATTASPDRSARRPNSMVVHGIPGPYKLGRGDILSIDIGVDPRRLGRRRGDHAPDRPDLAGGQAPAGDHASSRCSTPSSSARSATAWATSRNAVQTTRREGGLRASSARSSATASGATCTRTRRSRTSARPARARCSRRAWSWPIEPMVNVGTHPIRIGRDNWSVYSQDGSLAAHFEFTVAVTADGPRILTPGTRKRPCATSSRPPDASACQRQISERGQPDQAASLSGCMCARAVSWARCAVLFQVLKVDRGA